MRTNWTLAITVVAAAWLAGAPANAQKNDTDWLAQCRSQGDTHYRHCEVRPLTLPASSPLKVDARPNGGVQITGSDQAAVSGSARIQVQADSEADARAIASQIVVGTSTGALRADGPKSSDGRSWSVSFVLSTPRHTDLQIDAQNGPVGITGVTGQIKASTTNGPLSLVDLGGNVHARTSNGPLSILLAGSSWNGDGLDAETRNGPVSVKLPDGYSAQLEASTVNGPFHLGIPVTIQGELPGGRTRSIKTPIGSGGAPVRAVTTNGPVSISKR